MNDSTTITNSPASHGASYHDESNSPDMATYTRDDKAAPRAGNRAAATVPPAADSARCCANCTSHDTTDGCAHGFPDDTAVCSAHQTTTEADAGVAVPDKNPASVLIQPHPRQH